MTELNCITDHEISKLKPENFFDLLEMYGISIPLFLLERFLNAASGEVKETKDFEFFEGLYFGRMIERGNVI